MAKQSQNGYTLIELMLVMAITSLLAATVFEGQLQLRTQAQFDSDVDKVVATISQARDEATAGINDVGNGTGIGDGCPGGGTVPAVFAGDTFSADNASPGGPFVITFYEANPNVAACSFGTPISLNLASGVNVSGASQGEAFVRTAVGGIDACPTAGLSPAQVAKYFQDGGCNSGSWSLNLQDANGHKSTIQVDQSGLAKRLN